MGNYTIFRRSKILGEAGKLQIFRKKCSKNSRSQIVFRTDIFRKLTLGAPDCCYKLYIKTLLHAYFLVACRSAAAIIRKGNLPTDNTRHKSY